MVFTCFEDTAMNRIADIASTLTDRYQTTIPETVRNSLGLQKRDKLHYQIMPDGTVLLSRAHTAHEDDPALAGFLALLENDLQNRPAVVRPLGAEQRARVRGLIGDADVDLDAKLDPADE
jgi:antitoxin PrlF